MIDFIRKHLIINVFFLFLSVCLFLGDGQQMLIDVVGAGGVLVLVLVAFLYGKRQRELPLTPTLLFGGTILYFCIRTVFSDDIGYSVYTTIRTIEAFIIFYILYCFTTDEDRKVFPAYLLGFCIFSLFASIVYIFTPILSNTLTKSNLLVPTYGHNNVVDILLFGIPIAFFQLISQKKPLYQYIIMFLLFGIIFSFSRTAMMIVVLFLVISVLFYWKIISLKKRLFLGFFFFSILGILSLLLVIPQTTYKKYVLITILPKMTKQVDGAGNRFEYFRQAIEAIKERPLFGSGPGTFLLQSKRLQKTPDSYSRYAHNVLLQELTEVGIIGTVPPLLLFLWFLIHAIRMYRKEQGNKRFTLVVLTSCVLLQTLNALMDFSLNYFIIQMLYVSMIAVILSFDTKREHANSSINKVILAFSISLIFSFYVIISLCSVGFGKQIPLIKSCCFLSEFISVQSLKSSDKQLTQFERQMITQLHEKNSEMLSYLGSSYLHQASLLVPLDFATQRKYLQDLFDNKNVDEIGKALKKISLSLLLTESSTDISNFERNRNIQLQIDAIDFLNPNLKHAYETVSLDILNETDGSRIAFTKYFYFLGYAMISIDPAFTGNFWKLAILLSPEWSYFHVELASLEYYIFHNNDVTEQVLDACRNFLDPLNHCEATNITNIPRPGFFSEDVHRIPKKGIYIEKQFEKNQ